MKAVGQQYARVWDEPSSSSSNAATSSLSSSVVNRGEYESHNYSELKGEDDEQEGQYVIIDKDVKLIRDHFQLNHLHYADMSPILIPRGYTKSYLDGEIDHAGQLADIRRAYLNIVRSTSTSCNNLNAMADRGREGSTASSITICEGTGHAGVGSVVGAGNARVAAELGADVVLVANGGLGRAFDELELNRSLCLVSGKREQIMND